MSGQHDDHIVSSGVVATDVRHIGKRERPTDSTTERSARMSSRISMRSSRCVIPTTPDSSPPIGLG